MTTERLNMIILTLQAITNNKNRETVMDAIIDLCEHSYDLGKGKQDFYWLRTALEEAKVIL